MIELLAELLGVMLVVGVTGMTSYFAAAALATVIVWLTYNPTHARYGPPPDAGGPVDGGYRPSTTSAEFAPREAGRLRVRMGRSRIVHAAWAVPGPVACGASRWTERGGPTPTRKVDDPLSCARCAALDR